MILILKHDDGQETKIEFDHSVKLFRNDPAARLKLWVDSRQFAMWNEKEKVFVPFDSVYEDFSTFTVEP